MRIGVALGAGGARGFAYISLVEAFDELGLRPSAIAGSSMGAIIGAGWAAGVRGRDMRAYSKKLFGDRTAFMRRLWVKGRNGLPTLFGGFNLRSLDTPAVLDVLIPDGLPERFEDLSIDFCAVATDFHMRTRREFRSGCLHTALSASAAIPGVFSPVVVDGHVLFDGGVIDPVPIGALHPATTLKVAVDVLHGPAESVEAVPTAAEALTGAQFLMLQTIIAQRLAETPPDILFRPDVNAYSAFNFFKAPEILDVTLPFKDEVKRRMERLLEATALPAPTV